MMKEVLEFLKNSETFYLATCEEDQPRVRPFGAVAEFEGKLYFITNNQKKVFAQMLKNPKIEISSMYKDIWIRVEGMAIHDETRAAREKMIADNPSLAQMYSADDGLMEVFYIKEGTATIYSFTDQPRVIKF